MTAIDFSRYSSDPDVAPDGFASVDDAADFLSSLKCRPFGLLDAEFSLYREDASGAWHARLSASIYMLDSKRYDFVSEHPDEPTLDDYMSQEFSVRVPDYVWQSRELLIDEVGSLLARFMAHEGFEWLRFEDGVHVLDPHPDGETRV